VAQADAQLAAVARERAAIEARFAAREAVCYTSSSPPTASTKPRKAPRALSAQRAIEIEAQHFKRNRRGRGSATAEVAEGRCASFAEEQAPQPNRRRAESRPRRRRPSRRPRRPPCRARGRATAKLKRRPTAAPGRCRQARRQREEAAPKSEQRQAEAARRQRSQARRRRPREAKDAAARRKRRTQAKKQSGK
jgi:colicin import membrane protein